MKGILFEVVAQVVERSAGHAAWDAALTAAGSHGAFTSLGSYDDGEFLAIVGAVADQRGEAVADTARWLGRRALPLLVERYPTFAVGHNTRSFVLTLNHVIHPEVRKLFPGADAPDFIATDRPDGAVALEYRSTRALCTLAEGLILGTGDHFADPVQVSQSECVHRGDERCMLELVFTSAGGATSTVA